MTKEVKTNVEEVNAIRERNGIDTDKPKSTPKKPKAKATPNKSKAATNSKPAADKTPSKKSEEITSDTVEPSSAEKIEKLQRASKSASTKIKKANARIAELEKENAEMRELLESAKELIAQRDEETAMMSANLAVANRTSREALQLSVDIIDAVQTALKPHRQILQNLLEKQSILGGNN